LVATIPNGPTDEFLVGVGTVDIDGAEMSDAQVLRAMDRADGLVIATGLNID
jgi:hypothetical protein